MVSDLEQGRLSAARDILSYLQKTPSARDSVEGIAGFWLAREQVDRSIEAVIGGLRFLIERDLVLEKTDVTGRPYYQINPGKTHEMSKALAEIRRALALHRREVAGLEERRYCLLTRFDNLVAGALEAASRLVRDLRKTQRFWRS